jgi:hypothetical protein
MTHLHEVRCWLSVENDSHESEREVTRERREREGKLNQFCAN